MLFQIGAKIINVLRGRLANHVTASVSAGCLANHATASVSADSHTLIAWILQFLSISNSLFLAPSYFPLSSVKELTDLVKTTSVNYFNGSK